MERSSRRILVKNVLRRYYAFMLGATVCAITFRTVSPMVGEEEVVVPAQETVSVEEQYLDPIRMEEMMFPQSTVAEDLQRVMESRNYFDIGDDLLAKIQKETEEKVESPIEEPVKEMDPVTESGYVATADILRDYLVKDVVEEEEEEHEDIITEMTVAQAPKVEPHTIVVEESPTEINTAMITKSMPVKEEIAEAIAVEPEIINEAMVAEILEVSVETESIVVEEISEEIVENISTEAIAITQVEPNITYGNWGPDSPLFSSSGLQPEQIAKVLNGTEMEGLEQVVYDTEQKYGINACILLAIACNESGYGASRMAHRQNNLFGMMGMKFTSLEDNIDYFGRLMVKYRDDWHKTMTANGIARAYVGQNENTAGWPKKITGIMNQIYAKATN